MRGDINFKGSDSSGLSVNFYSVPLDYETNALPTALTGLLAQRLGYKNLFFLSKTEG